MNRSFHLTDELVVTIVAMLVVFIVLAAIWALMELIHRLIGPPAPVSPASAPVFTPSASNLPYEKDDKKAAAAAIAALIQAYEDNPAQKYEILEIKRVK